MRPTRGDALALGGLTAVALGVFWRWLIAPTWTLYSEWSDVIVQYDGWKWFMADHARRTGELAFWNPHYFGGTPAYANPQYLWLHPLHVLFHIIPVDQAIAPTFLLFVVLVGTGTHVWLRLCGLDVRAAAFGGLVAAVAPRLLYHIVAGFLAAMAGIAMLPWVFAATEYACRRPSPWRWGLVALALALLLSSCFVQLWLYAGYGLLLYVLVRPLAGWAVADEGTAYTPAPSARARLWRVLGLAGAYVGSLVLAAYYFWPAYVLQQHTTREGALSTELLLRGRLGPWHWLTAVVPQPWGDPSGVTTAGHGDWQLWDHSMAFGIVPLLLLLPGRRGRYRPLWRGLLALLAASLLLASGPSNPVLALVYRLPGMAYFRFPSRFLFLAGMAIAGLAALGFAALLDGRDAARLRRTACWYALGAVLLGGLAVWVWRGASAGRFVQDAGVHAVAAAACAVLLALACFARGAGGGIRPLAAVCVLLAVADSVFSAGWAVRMKPSDLVYRENEPIRWLRSRPGVARTADFRGAIHLGMPERADVYVLGGYDPMQLAPTVRYFAAATDEPPSVSNLLTFPRVAAPRLFALLGVRWTLATEPKVDGMRPVRAWSDVPTYAFGRGIGVLGGPTYLFEYPRALPRAFVVGPARRVAVEDETRALRAFEPTEEVLLARPPPVVGTAAFRAAAIELYEPNRVRVRATSDGPGYLVLTDAWYPAWHAKRNGAPTPVLRADGMFRAVLLPTAGEWTVEFRYVPRAEITGGIVTGVALLALAVLGVLDRRAYSKPGPSSSSSASESGERS